MLLAKSKESKNFVKSIAWPILAGLLCFSPIAFSQTSDTSVGTIASIFLSLFLVVALVFALGFVLKKINVTHAGNQQLKPVASMMLGNRERLMVVQVGDEQHLLGITPQSISHLSKLTTPLESEQSGDKFKSRLAQMLQQRKEAEHD